MRERGSRRDDREDKQGRSQALRPRDDGRELTLIYKRLRSASGFKNWWPANSPFEIFVGAILAQQTTWGNVEKAIAKLREADAISLDAIAEMNIRKLEGLIRSAGYYRQKARRLKGIAVQIRKEFGTIERLMGLAGPRLRKVLLSYNGIGDETADSIMLYAAGRRTFVIDAYTKRIMGRVDKRLAGADYLFLQRYFTNNTKASVLLYKDYHAQLVELAKRNCRVTPICKGCPLLTMCDYGNEARIHPYE